MASVGVSTHIARTRDEVFDCLDDLVSQPRLGSRLVGCM
jgi:hypothetical protein